MKTQSKLRKKLFTSAEQACQQVRGLKKLFEELDDKASFRKRKIIIALPLLKNKGNRSEGKEHNFTSPNFVCFYFSISKNE